MDGIFASYHVRNGRAAGGFFGCSRGGFRGGHFGCCREEGVSDEWTMVMLVRMAGEGKGEGAYLAIGHLPGVDRGWRGEWGFDCVECQLLTAWNV